MLKCLTNIIRGCADQAMKSRPDLPATYLRRIVLREVEILAEVLYNDPVRRCLRELLTARLEKCDPGSETPAQFNDETGLA
jgi:hypothetical protein